MSSFEDIDVIDDIERPESHTEVTSTGSGALNIFDAFKRSFKYHFNQSLSSDADVDKANAKPTSLESEDVGSLETGCQQCKLPVVDCRTTVRLLWSRWRTHIGLLVAIGILFTVFTFELAYGASCDGVLGAEFYTPVHMNIPTDQLPGSPFKVLLFGDSLVSRTSINLVTTIESFLPNTNLAFSVKSYWGTGVGKLKEYMPMVIANATAEMGGIDAVILCWDTDSSDTDWKHMDKTDKVLFRDRYVEDLAYIIKYITARVPRMAIAGPEVSGEGPLFTPKTFNGVEYDYFKLRRVYEASRIVNRAMSELYMLPYIDIRQAFLDHTPWYRLGFKDCLTADGEHENARGTMIVAKLFAETINGWMNLAYIGSVGAGAGSGDSMNISFSQPKYISFLYPDSVTQNTQPLL